ncbi:uncharacterized protein EV422DRAFT_514721 [Fimicolochytrium jonesii]|uniref:uncharacterized protein n=1 Tax=Fimicolochytrium jonesii TaxID=1396493 RepID=UPI0022FE0757|nr:uncharacterized protein EV422DRAFT_514721 [Fimicolochytrium jonesii]KAI8825937.1 hypothetical protein EV422DRAFT_514721 [Fimicolochytrium jonesii]
METIRFLPGFVYGQLFTSLPKPEESAEGKTVIVTGSNVGLGLECARYFSKLGAAKVILAVRTIAKGNAAKEDIERSSGKKNVEVWELDLMSYASVKAFARRVEKLPRLDAIIENAGISTFDFKIAEQDESTITTNVVSTFLLALLVLPKLRESAEKFGILPHLVIVSSEVHFMTSFPEKAADNIFEKLNDEKTARMWDRYNVSKLIEVFIVRELVNVIANKPADYKPNVVINFLNPGLCHSELVKVGGITGMGVTLLKAALARSTEYGSRTLVHAAHAGLESHGQYLSNCRITPVAPMVTRPEGVAAQKKLWAELSQKLESIQPGILNNI